MANPFFNFYNYKIAYLVPFMKFAYLFKKDALLPEVKVDK